MNIVDTNIHAAYLLQSFERDERTKQYLQVFATIPLGDRVVPDFILGEFETFITRVIPPRYQLNGDDKEKLKELTFDYIHRLRTECTLIVPDVATMQRAYDIYFENKDTFYISFADCLVLATAEQNKFAVFSKDERVNKIAMQLTIQVTAP
jgi:predicted nucleic acid-binding protein